MTRRRRTFSSRCAWVLVHKRRGMGVGIYVVPGIGVAKTMTV